MQITNIKIFIGISLVLVIILLIIIFLPLGKKISTPEKNTGVPSLTPVEINPTLSGGKSQITPTINPADFTGVNEITLPPEVFNTSLQKQNLRKLVPLEMSAFSIDFDYGEDKFTVTLKDPKDQSRIEFDKWRQSNYPALDNSKFNFR